MKMKRITGLLLALFMTIGCLSLNPIASYANDAGTKTFNINQGSVNITKDGIYTINGTGQPTSNTISVTGSNIKATITLKNVNIDVPNQNQKAAFLAKNNDQSNVHLTIILEGTNSLKSGETWAGLKWNNSNNNSKLEIKGDGSLTAEGGESGAGIGGGNGGSGKNITIAGGTVTATGGAAGSMGGGAAGIGGGFRNSGENIKITGGTVIATGGSSAAGIGGGSWGSGKNITITGGTVTATGGRNAADIGGGFGVSGENVKITGGSVKASRIGTTPTDGNGNRVYLAKLENQDGVNELTVDSGTDNKKTFKRAGNHPDGDTAFYLYLTGQDHDLVTSKGKYNAEWNSNANRFAIIEFDSTNVNSMSVTSQPTKRTYTEGENLDLTGLVVTLTDGHGKTKEVKPDKFTANNITATPDNGTELKLDHNENPVKLTRGNLTAETEKLTVNKLNPTSMSVTSQPTKRTYTEGENLDLTGLEVTLEDDNHVKKVVTPAEFEANGIKATPENGKKLELTDGGKPVTLTRGNLTATTNDLKVAKLNPTSMSVTSQPSKLSYTEGESLALDGLVVTLKDDKGVTKTVEPKDFEANEIKATPENGKKLELTDGGKPVTLTRGNLTAATGALKVKAKESSSEHGESGGSGSASGSGSLPSPSPLPGGSSTGMNDNAPTIVDKDELNIQIDSAESDSKPGNAGDGAGNGNAGNANAGSAPEVEQADAAVKQADALDDALAQAKRVAANSNATQAQVDAAVRKLADARKAQHETQAPKPQTEKRIGMVPTAPTPNPAAPKSQPEAQAPKLQHEVPAPKLQSKAPAPKSLPEKRIGMIPKKGESASFAGLLALYAGLLAVLGFSIAGFAILLRRK